MPIRRDKLAHRIIDEPRLETASVSTRALADGAVTTAKIADAAVTTPKIADGAVTNVKHPANEHQFIIDIPILGGAGQSVAADSTGAKNFTHTTFTVPAEALKHLKSASLIVDYAWAATADGTIQLYDVTAAAVRGESSAKAGGEKSEWESFSVSGLVAGNTMVVRANITAAGAAGENVTLYRVILRLVCGIS